MPDRVQRPAQGGTYRVVRRRYVDGSFIIEGRRVRKALCKLANVERAPSGKKRTAKQIHDAIEAIWESKRRELEEGLGEAPGDTVPMSRLFADWMRQAADRGRSAATQRSRALCRDYYLGLVGDHPVEEALPHVRRRGYDLAHADAFRAGLRNLRAPRGNQVRPLSPARINTYLRLLHGALLHAEQRYWLVRAPRVEKVAEPRRPTRAPRPEDIAAMRRRLVHLSRTAPHGRDRYQYRLHRVLFYLLLGTGMRGGEALPLRRDQVDLERRAILLVKTKTGAPRIVRIGHFLAGKLRAHFAAHPGQTQLFEHPTRPGAPAWRGVAEASKAFARHMAEVGIEGAFKPLHGYRAGLATLALNDIALPPTALRDQLGHTDLQTTLRYYVTGMGDAQLATVDALEGRLLRGRNGKNGNGVSAASVPDSGENTAHERVRPA
jgi:integrase